MLLRLNASAACVGSVAVGCIKVHLLNYRVLALHFLLLQMYTRYCAFCANTLIASDRDTS